MEIHNNEERYISPLPNSLNSQNTCPTINSHVNNCIDAKLKSILNQRHKQHEEIIQLKSELDEAKYNLRELKEQIPNSINFHHPNAGCMCDSEQQSINHMHLTELYILSTHFVFFYFRTISKTNMRFEKSNATISS